MFLYKQKYLKDNVEIRSSLRVIYGVGFYKSFLLSSRIGLGFPYFSNYLNFYNFYLLSTLLDECTLLEVKVKRIIYENIKSLLKIKCYKGFRHRDLLPCRGQRTRTNAKSCKRQLKIK